MRPSLHRITRVRVYLLPVQTRVPLKFGAETLTSATVLRVAMEVADENNRTAEGWGETPLSVQWVWPSPIPYSVRHEALIEFSLELARSWAGYPAQGHPLEAGYDFQTELLPGLVSHFNQKRSAAETRALQPAKSGAMPWLAALVCNSAFDIALHDAFGRLVERPIYSTYGPEFLTRDLSAFLESAEDAKASFRGCYPVDFLVKKPPTQLMAWHLVGGLDPLKPEDLSGTEPQDGCPILLPDWIERDGLRCLKVKLRGNDQLWDFNRIVSVGQLAFPRGVEWLTADFNCTVQDPAYVNGILDDLKGRFPAIHDRLLYVEQPFPYDLETNQIDVHSVSARKPLFLDESAHDWRMIRLGRQLGWTGVALKTCKTQTGAILSACWARAHRMDLMVQDLTNPMLAQIPHLLLAAHVGTLMGVETNSMQFYPEASALEAKVHPGLYQRRGGLVDLASIRGPGFGYRFEEIQRVLPEPALVL
jgi:L-alanine-DL-glutamate epimerase-like enolase superfamily enzyme